MKRAPAYLAPMMALALAAALPLSASETVRHFGQQLDAAGTDRIAVDLPVGEATITGWDQDQVAIDLVLKCHHDSGRCAAAAKATRLVYRTTGGTLRIELKDWPKLGGKGLQMEAKISVPRDRVLQANLGVGELNISGIEADVDADLGVGEMNVHLPLASFREAHLDTGIGESSLVAGEARIEHGGLIAREIDWHEGRGRSQVRLDCGVGEIDLTMK